MPEVTMGMSIDQPKYQTLHHLPLHWVCI